MKRIIALFLAAVLCVCLLSGCTSKTENDDGKIHVLGTVFPPFDFAREIGGDLVFAEMLMSPGTDSHSYSGDNPSDILKIANCDLFIYVGGESESTWVENVLRTVEKAYGKAPESLDLSEYCDLLEESDKGIVGDTDHGGISFSHHGEHEGHNHGDHEDCAFDEHIWTSLSNAEKMAEAICNKLSEMDGENSDIYKENLKNYKERLQELDGSFKELFTSSPKNPIVFADRFPFAYFSESYGLECYAAFGGCATENEPSPSTLATLAGIINDNSLKSIFYIETSKSNVPNALCRMGNAKAYLIHSCHTVTEKQLKDGVTYLTLMENNLDSFRKALSNDG